MNKTRSLCIVAPLRIDLGGGLTDISSFSDIVGTNILNLAIDLFEDEHYKKEKTILVKIKRCKNQNKLFINRKLQNKTTQPVIESILANYSTKNTINCCYEVSIKNNFPKSTGLGSSAVISLSLIFGLTMINTIRNKKSIQNANYLIRKAYFFENEKFGYISGFQDFVSAYYGKLNRITLSFDNPCCFLDSKNFCLEIEDVFADYLNNNMLVLLLKNKFAFSSEVIKYEAKQLKVNKELTVVSLLEIKDLNQKIYNIVNKKMELQRKLTLLGNYMNKSWVIQKKLIGKFKNPLLEQIEDKINPFVFGLRGPGAGVNSLFFISKPNQKKRIIKILQKYSNKTDLLFAKINEKGMCFNEEVL